MTLLHHARALALDLLDLVAPPRCVACGDPYPARLPLCAGCDEHLLPAEDAPPGVRVPFAHGGPLARAIYRAKYDGDPSVAVALGHLLAAHAELPAARYAWVVPVPLHGARLRARGYNQAHELGRCLARRLGAPLASGLVACRNATVFSPSGSAS